ncbi:MAG: hypothetical protein WA960_17885 [Tunicatimonas sp.]
MTYSRLLSLVLLLTCFAFLSACQEEEDASIFSNSPKIIDKYEASNPDKSEIIAKATLYSDKQTTEFLGQQGQISYVILRRPKGCPVRISPLCYPDLGFFSNGFEGIDPTRFNYKEYDGLISDPETGSVVAILTDISENPETGAVTLIYSPTEKAEVVSDQLQVTFGSLYDTGKSIEQVGFEGKVTSDIVDFLR